MASEPYGLVEETTRYLRMDGETPADPENPTASRGQVVALDGVAGRHARRHPAARATTAPSFPVTDDELVTAQITTRDIDRGDYPHFLLKEITESPASFRKTLRGKLVERDGAARASRSATRRLPDDVRDGPRAPAASRE